MDSLEKLFYLTGVSASYLDYSGECHQIAREDRMRVLRAMGYDALDPQAVERAVFELDARPWQQWLKPCYVLGLSGTGVIFHCCQDELTSPIEWRLAEEPGNSISGSVIPEQCPRVGEYYIGETCYSAWRLGLGDVPEGYHWLEMKRGDRCEKARVIVCPARCFELSEADRRQLWGISCQLYTLRSARNWGIGDFSDLRELIELAAPYGVDIIGLNPLHVPCSDSPDEASPYSSSDRRFINPLYLDPKKIDEFSHSPSLAKLCGSAAFKRELDSLRSGDLIDHDRVSQVKFRVFGLLFQVFCNRHLSVISPRGREFFAYVDAQGKALRQFSAFEASHNRHAGKFASDPRFYQYLQWQCAQQLCNCQERALNCGMQVGLLGDLAVGSVPQGSEVAGYPDLFAPGVTIGAPPDPFASQGQEWGLPATNPLVMKQNHFEHFISVLQTNMAHVGALRIDHAMALLRLWWCLPAKEDRTRTGVYVYYPQPELMSLLRLESQRNHCLVVGEDLGLVQDEFRRAMRDSGLYGNKLLYFERHFDGRFKSPEELQEDALLMVTNHDVPTLADWWSRGDLLRRFDLGLIPDRATLDEELGRRDGDKQQMLHWLSENHLLPENWNDTSIDRPFDYDFCTAIHRLCARGKSRLLLLQLEDLQLLREPVNIPGTYREYPNWRRKQTGSTHEIFRLQPVQTLLHSVNQERRRDDIQ